MIITGKPSGVDMLGGQWIFCVGIEIPPMFKVLMCHWDIWESRIKYNTRIIDTSVAISI